MYLVAFIRLLILPLLALGLTLLIPGLDKTARTILIIQMAMPTAAIAPAIARKYDGEYKLISDAVAMTTLLSLLTIPLWVGFANY